VNARTECREQIVGHLLSTQWPATLVQMIDGVEEQVLIEYEA
jgi:hypothetical protein